MNEPEFEQQLRDLRPVRPSRGLEERLARELSAAAAPRAGALGREGKSWLERCLPALGWGGLGAAAAVVVMLALNLVHRDAAKPGDARTGAALTRTAPETSELSSDDDEAFSGDVLEASDEGLLDGGLARRVRYSSVERRSWTDANGAVTVVEIPREDVVAVPVSIQ